MRVGRGPRSRRGTARAHRGRGLGRRAQRAGRLAGPRPRGDHRLGAPQQRVGRGVGVGERSRPRRPSPTPRGRRPPRRAPPRRRTSGRTRAGAAQRGRVSGPGLRGGHVANQAHQGRAVADHAMGDGLGLGPRPCHTSGATRKTSIRGVLGDVETAATRSRARSGRPRHISIPSAGSQRHPVARGDRPPARSERVVGCVPAVADAVGGVGGGGGSPVPSRAEEDEAARRFLVRLGGLAAPTSRRQRARRTSRASSAVRRGGRASSRASEASDHARAGTAIWPAMTTAPPDPDRAEPRIGRPRHALAGAISMPSCGFAQRAGEQVRPGPRTPADRRRVPLHSAVMSPGNSRGDPASVCSRYANRNPRASRTSAPCSPCSPPHGTPPAPARPPHRGHRRRPR